MNSINSIFIAITKNLSENVSRIQFGEATVKCKVHSGKITSVTYSLTENTVKAVSDKEIKLEAKNARN